MQERLERVTAHEFRIVGKAKYWRFLKNCQPGEPFTWLFLTWLMWLYFLLMHWAFLPSHIHTGALNTVHLYPSVKSQSNYIAYPERIPYIFCLGGRQLGLFVCSLFILMEVLEIKPRTSCMLNVCSTTEFYPPCKNILHFEFQSLNNHHQTLIR